MKASELMIGRFYSASAEFKGSIEARLNFNGEQREFLMTKEILILILQLDLEKWVKPIPITEEWLLQFGFIEDRKWKNLWFKDGLGLWWYSEHQSVMLHKCKSDKIDYRYVHQLQNLFYTITGEELQPK